MLYQDTVYSSKRHAFPSGAWVFNLLRLFSAVLLLVGGGRGVQVPDFATALELPDAASEVVDVDITAIRSQFVEGFVEVQEVVNVGAAGPLAAGNVLGELLGILRADELVVLRSADVDEGVDRGRAVGGVKGGVVDGVAVDLADIKIFLDLGDLFGDNSVGDTPDALWRRCVTVLLLQLLPVRPLNKSDNTTRSLGGASVILTGGLC